MKRLRLLIKTTRSVFIEIRKRDFVANMTPLLNGTELSKGNIKHMNVVKSFVDVGGVPTQVVQVGQLQEPKEQKQRHLILVVPGNPGIPTFYEDFMRELHYHSGGEIPVWAISHAGHARPPDQTLSFSDVFATDEKKFGLEAQIDHKAMFIRDNVPPDVKVILIGHSIGCYFILNALDKLPIHHVQRCFLLFPTIERMATSPNGLSLTPLVRYLRWIIVLVTFFCILLPTTLREKLIRFIYRKVDYPPCMIPSILSTVTPWTTNFTTFLAKTEMNKVTTLQKDLLTKHFDKLSLYYGARDLWCPVEYYKDMVEEFPTIDARLCEMNMKHAFVMVEREGRQMADILWKWLQSQDISKSMNGEINGTHLNGVTNCHKFD